jgi:hypothetical protein
LRRHGPNYNTARQTAPKPPCPFWAMRITTRSPSRSRESCAPFRRTRPQILWSWLAR